MVTVVTLIGHLSMTALIKSCAEALFRNENTHRAWLYATYWSALIQACTVFGLIGLTWSGCEPSPSSQNMFCIDNPTLGQVLVLAYQLGVIMGDLLMFAIIVPECKERKAALAFKKI
jgi:hypothetical protein